MYNSLSMLNMLTFQYASSRGVSSLIAMVGMPKLVLKSFSVHRVSDSSMITSAKYYTCVTWRRFNGDIMREIPASLGSSRSRLRTIGSVLPFPVPAPIKES
jgi:hypothetical protein